MDWIYVDTSAWVSMADSAEVAHERVAETLSEHRGRLITSDHVLQETWTVMRYRHGAAPAETLVNAIRAGIARVEVSLLADLEVAAAIGRAFEDQDFSLSDRTSWAVMERLGLSVAISLDRDFRVYRYGSDRRRALNVLP
ncbi:MAG: PIN domain-containing protein [Acidimicrobiaceae bacterium]|nr:PIN domain-containing protein [Acidimicrobiaceae bacterium]MDE0606118.1 PIN domain-containing protein [Acidimicrobiaceae bacterium]